MEYYNIYYNLKFGLQKLLNRPIDLLEQKAIKNPFFLKQLNKNNFLIHTTENTIFTNASKFYHKRHPYLATSSSISAFVKIQDFIALLETGE